MKTIRVLIVLASILCLAIYYGCQEDEGPDPDLRDQAFKPEEEITGLILRVAMNDGSIDNIIDQSSCTSLVLPLTVTVNDTELLIDDVEDYYTVEYIMDKFQDDEDAIDISFPVTVIQADHSELLINNEEELEALADQCPENQPDEDIECIDFVYPITLYVFNTQNQIPATMVLENDRDLHDFFKEFDGDELASFRYPIYLKNLPSNSYSSVNNRSMLENYISAAVGTCEEDDDNDHNDDDADVAYLKAILIAGKWVIGSIGVYYINDETFIFRGYTIDFLENGVVEAITEYETFTGSYYAFGDYGVPELELDFGGVYPLYQLDKKWECNTYFEDESSYDIDASTISLLSGMYYLDLIRPNRDSFWYLDMILGNGTWKIAQFTNSGIDETGNYHGFVFDFKEGSSGVSGSIVISKDDETVNGTWFFSKDMAGWGPFDLDLGDLAPWNELNKKWEVIGAKTSLVELFHFNEDDGSSDMLIFERNDM